MVDLNKHVTWGHLQYYDAQIKKYVNNLNSKLADTLATSEEVESIKQKLEQISETSTTIQARIEELFNENIENESNIDKLFEFDKTNSENIKELQTRFDYIATKEEVAEVSGSVKSIFEAIDTLEKQIKHDHDVLEVLLVDVATKADRDYVDEAIKNVSAVDLSDYYTKSEVENLIPDVDNFVTTSDLNSTLEDFATEAEFRGFVEELASVQEDLERKANKSDLIGYATEGYVNNAIAAIPPVDLREYATHAEVDYVASKIPDVSVFATKVELEEAINSIEHPTVDLTGYATEEFVIKKIAEAELADQDVDLSAYYTKSETEAVVKAAVDAIDIPDVSGLATKEELKAVQNVAGSNSVKLFAIESDLVDMSQTLENIPTTYSTKDEVAAVEAKVDAIIIPEVPTKVSELENDAGYVTSTELKQDVYYLDVTGYESGSELTPKQSEFMSRICEDKNVIAYLRDRQYSDKFELASRVTCGPISPSGNYVHLRTEVDYTYISEGLKITWQNYRFENEGSGWKLYDVWNEEERSLAYVEYVDRKIDSIHIPETDLSNYYNKSETENLIAEAVKDIEHPTVDLDGYATEEWVTQQGYLTEHQDLSDYAKKSDIPSLEGYAKLTDIPTDYLVESDIANKADKSDLEGLASTDYVDQAIARIPETDVSNLATKSELEAVEAKIPTDYLTTIPEEYVTKTELDAEGFVKSLDGYATETFVTDAINNIKHPDPDLSNYYTKGETDSAINEAISGIDIPKVDLAPYATKAEVAEQVAAKADNVLFTENLIVTNPVGGFLANDSVTRLTIKEIIYKLLSLKEVVTPETPGGASSVVQDIIDNRRPIYSQDAEGNLVETPFDYVVWSVEDAANEHDGENDFYQIVDAEGNLIESGYHESTEYQEEAYLTIALPSTVTSVTAKMWDPDSNDFVEQNWKLIPTEDEHTNGYTVWTVPEEYEVLSGDVFRFVINN